MGGLAAILIEIFILIVIFYLLIIALPFVLTAPFLWYYLRIEKYKIPIKKAKTEAIKIGVVAATYSVIAIIWMFSNIFYPYINLP